MAARGHASRWAVVWRLARAVSLTSAFCAMLACAVLLLATPPLALCYRLAWRGSCCGDQCRRILRRHLDLRRSRCAPLRLSPPPGVWSLSNGYCWVVYRSVCRSCCIVDIPSASLLAAARSVDGRPRACRSPALEELSLDGLTDSKHPGPP